MVRLTEDESEAIQLYRALLPVDKVKIKEQMKDWVEIEKPLKRKQLANERKGKIKPIQLNGRKYKTKNGGAKKVSSH